MKTRYAVSSLIIGTLTVALAGLAMPVHADVVTNLPVVTPDPIQVSGFWDSVRAALHYRGLTPQQISFALVAIHFVAKYVRNYWLANRDTNAGRIAQWVAHVALKPLPAAPEPQVPAMH